MRGEAPLSGPLVPSWGPNTGGVVFLLTIAQAPVSFNSWNTILSVATSFNVQRHRDRARQQNLDSTAQPKGGHSWVCSSAPAWSAAEGGDGWALSVSFRVFLKMTVRTTSSCSSPERLLIPFLASGSVKVRVTHGIIECEQLFCFFQKKIKK